MLKVLFPVFFPRFYCSYTKTISEIDHKPVIYGDECSPPVRFVLMTASALGIELDYQEVDLFSNKHKTEFYKAINPLQKVPAMKIKDQVICDSHAISMYLCEQNRDNNLYPNESSTRTRINEMLFFNSGTLFPIDSSIFTDYFAGKWPVNQEKLDTLYSALDHLEFCLHKNIWLTGDEVRISDICLMSTVTSIYQIVPRSHKHNRINEWLQKCEKLSFYKINDRGLRRLQKYVNLFKQ